MKRLVIAEKPSVARDLVKVLGKFQKKEDFFENDDYVVTSAIGHLVELFMPEDMDSKYKRWTLDSLPIIPNTFGLKIIDTAKKKFNEIKKLLHRKDIDGIINACDAGREGELIFSYICELAGNKKPFQRLWLSSMTAESIREAFQRLRSSEEMQALQAAARCRSEADWIVGINGTRALTLRISSRGSRQVASVGRVQTPTLAMIVGREREIQHFQPRDYWRIVGQFQIHNGTYESVFQRKNFQKDPDNVHDRIDRLWDLAEAQQILEDIHRHQNNIHIQEKKKRTTQIAPKLYDLTLLQREANNRFHMPAGMTLKIAQSLYEKHKCTTYPRTDSQALPEDYGATCKEVLSSLTGEYAPFAQKILKQYGVDARNKRIFNNQHVSDHFAIIPTGKNPTELSSEEEKIYKMLVQRFLAVFFPAAEFDVTTRLTLVGPHEFKTEGKVLIQAGWLEVYGREQEREKDEVLVGLHEQDGQPPSAQMLDLQSIQESTKAPPRYNEATLLAMMEGAGKIVEDEELAEAMKERGLGTPATRAQIIEHLINYRYMERDKKDLIPTAKAEDLFRFLEKVRIEAITSPAMTGEWEFRLRQVENRQLSRENFMKGIADMTQQMIASIQQFQESEADATLSGLISPTDQKPMLEMLRCYQSQDKLLTLYKTVAGRHITLEEYQELLRDRKTSLLEGFRSKIGKAFTAHLSLDEEWHVHFIFPENKYKKENSCEILSIKDLENYDVIGTCPLHAHTNRIFETKDKYICEYAVSREKNTCHLRIGKTLLEIPITHEHVQQLLKTRKTDMIEGFISKRTGKSFTAALSLRNDGNLKFLFLPRTASRNSPDNSSEQES
jgi:DNA topoisomerase-3